MTFIPLILPISNALSMHFLNQSNKLDKGILIFYNLLLVLALFFNTGLVQLARTRLYMYLPYTLIWLMLSVVYFLAPTVYAGYTVKRLSEKQTYAKQMATFVAYFSVIYMLLHVRVTSNWQVIQTCKQN
jgi:hypothetical protein